MYLKSLYSVTGCIYANLELIAYNKNRYFNNLEK